MPHLDERWQQWVVDTVSPGSAVVEVHGLREGGSPWRVVLDGNGARREVILRVGRPQDRTTTETEIAALEVARAHGVRAPALLAAAIELDPPLVAIEVVEGASTIPRDLPTVRLRRLGAEAARLHAIRVPMTDALPWRDRPIAGVDFAALRRQQTTPLLQRAEETLRSVPEGPAGFVHGDLWQGNTMWCDDELVAVIDWDCAGVGPAGVDLGSLRCDAAICFGLEAADHVLRGWEDEAGCAADDVARWDVVAALSTPADMGWFAEALAGQGRPDLDRSLLVRRRDEFLEAALDA